jgi:hypothetical protein
MRMTEDARKRCAQPRGPADRRRRARPLYADAVTDRIEREREAVRVHRVRFESGLDDAQRPTEPTAYVSGSVAGQERPLIASSS